MNTRKISVLAIAFSMSGLMNIYGQYACDKTILESLEETAGILKQKENTELWGVQLSAPVILIDHMKNKMYFTAIDNGQVEPLKEEAWDNKVPLANSYFNYNGKNHITIVYDALLHSSCEDRVNLLAHEIFHSYQKGLGLPNAASMNYHMDEPVGRALLQIEIQTLRKALQGDLQSLYDALYVKKYRQSLYPENNEEAYELNEGLAEYTGSKIGIKNLNDYITKRFVYNKNVGYTNGFGYITGAAYAYLLDDIYPGWQYDKELIKGMTHLLAKVDPRYNIVVDSVYLNKLFLAYNYEQILADEYKELQSFGDIASFENLLKPEAEKVVIPNNGVNFTFNPNDRVIALSDAVLLRNMTVSSEWGKVKVNSGMIRLNNWRAFYLPPPTGINGNTVKGDNYEITLNPGWKLTKKEKQWQIVKID
ncbi:MAG: hypothetical protein LBL90_09855 [Prevotellaceae bacterium]|jgi:hypothetical protein|nr:hypothetical protein [Prevotellaceae bacterium]